MNEDLAAFEKALETFLRIFREDVCKIVDNGSLPISYIIAFREPRHGEYETIQYIARSTLACPPGLEEALKEVVYKWAAETYAEFTPMENEPPVSNHQGSALICTYGEEKEQWQKHIC